MGRNCAIAIGINHYYNLTPLKYAQHDAEALRSFCQVDLQFDPVYFFAEGAPPISTTQGPGLRAEPTLGNLERFLNVRFEEKFLETSDNLWFFFAGHGKRYQGRDYLMPIDGDPGRVERTAIAIRDISDRLRRSGADNIILMVDACRGEGSRVGGLGIGQEKQQGVVTFFSCSPNELSYEIEQLGHGSFTHALLEGLRLQGEGNCATVERLDRHLRHYVPRLNQQYGKPVQTPYAMVEPAAKYHLILLPRAATVNDARTLMFEASKAENNGEYALANQLWIRVLAVSPADPEAIAAIRRLAIKDSQPKREPQQEEIVTIAQQINELEKNSQVKGASGSWGRVAETIELQLARFGLKRRNFVKLPQPLDVPQVKQPLSFFQAPPLPPCFVGRESELQDIKRQILLSNSDTNNHTLIIAIQGMRGVGKTTLAAAIAHEPEIRQRFLDGVLWANLSQQPELLSLLQDWIQVLNDYDFHATTVETASIHLRRLLTNKSILIVLEDVQDVSQVVPFINLGQKCCVLITSRSSNLGNKVLRVARVYPLDVLTPEESLTLLSRSLEKQLDQAEQELALRVAEKGGYHPLSLNLISSLIRRGESWFRLEQRLASLEGDLEHDLNERICLLEALYTREIENENLATLYSLQISLPPTPILVGSEIEIGLQWNLFETENSEAYLLAIPRVDSIGNEINILFVAPGFQLNSTNAASLPLIASTDLEASAQQTAQIARFQLTALQPGTYTVKFELFCGDTFKTTLENTIQVSPIETFQISQIDAVRSRPIPQPDLILQAQTIWNENLSTCTFRYHLDSFHPRLPFAREIQQQSETLPVGWLEQTRSLLQTTLEEATNSLPEDFRARLTSLGQHLFQQLLPPELQTTFHSVMRFSQPFTLLILADQDAGLPWELLHDGQNFWGERFIMGRWFLELDRTRPYEFAIGAVNVAHYADVEHPDQWVSLLEPSGAPPPIMLSGGVLADFGALDAVRGLHLLRRGKSLDEIDRQNAPVPFDRNGATGLDQELQPAKLSLRRNRPLVTLGYVNAGLAELTMLEQTWAPTFIRSGCSAFVGALWAVQPAVEATFVSSFYHRLWTGDSLGMAFQAGRRAARSLVPDSLDWMAYTLFGDPMTRPYRPTEGKGYAVVEPIGQEITDAIEPGAAVRFRVSLRRTPPVWYTNRLMDVAEDLVFNDLQVYIAASGLQVGPAESIGMQRTPTGDYLGWFTLTVPSTFAGDSALVQVHFEDGVEPIHSLRFSLAVGNREGEPQ